MKMVRTNNTMKETEARPLTSEEIDALMSKIEDGYHVTTGEDCVTELANQLNDYINELINFEDAEALSEIQNVLYSAIRRTEAAIENINNTDDDDFDEISPAILDQCEELDEVLDYEELDEIPDDEMPADDFEYEYTEKDDEQENMPKLYPTMRDAFRAEGLDF